ncbi:MAG: hypothetical protein HOW73_24180 [Polyangiaceae bacterium]|nr:hypothetical protein [Polyangiaceae bacterium]
MAQDRHPTIWTPVVVPPFCERLIGFSVPVDGRSLVLSYEAVHILTLGDSLRVDTDDTLAEYDIYDPEVGIATYHDTTYSILGLHGGRALSRSPTGAVLMLDQDKQVLTVTSDDVIELTCDYQNFSGDWAAATFSPDGAYILLGCPCDFDFRVWKRAI